MNLWYNIDKSLKKKWIDVNERIRFYDIMKE